MLREVVAASRVTSFEALVQLIEETGVRLADAGTKGESGRHFERKTLVRLHL